MKSRTSRLFLLVVMAVFTSGFLFQGCKKDLPKPTSASTATPRSQMRVSGVSIVNGRLKFADIDAFTNTMEELHGLETAELASWELDFDGFTSLRKKYETIDADNDSNRTELTTDSLFAAGLLLEVPDLRYASVLNEEGLMQIADTIFLLTTTREYKVPLAFEDDLENIQSLESNDQVFKRDAPGRLSSTDGEVVTTTEDPEPEPLGAPTYPVLGCSFTAWTMGQWWGWREFDHSLDVNSQPIPYHNGRPTRVKLSTWNTYYYSYASAGHRIKPQKHTKYAGWLNNLNANLILEGCFAGDLYMSTYPYVLTGPWSTPSWPNKACSSCNVLDHTSAWTANLYPATAYYYMARYNFHTYAYFQGRDIEISLQNY